MPWKKPEDGFVRVDVDGSAVIKPGKAGGGGLLGHATSEWIIGFSFYLGYSCNLHAELKALHLGLLLAWDPGFRRGICNSDSKEAL